MSAFVNNVLEGTICVGNNSLPHKNCNIDFYIYTVTSISVYGSKQTSIQYVIIHSSDKYKFHYYSELVKYLLNILGNLFWQPL